MAWRRGSLMNPVVADYSEMADSGARSSDQGEFDLFGRSSSETIPIEEKSRTQNTRRKKKPRGRRSGDGRGCSDFPPSLFLS
jgi:hypothetical protein